MRNLAELIARDPGRPLLRINVDTHRIPFHHALPQSLQTKRKLKNLSGLGPSKRKLVQNVGSGKQRVRFTHAALICDDVSLQPRLLQILIGNETLFPAATLGALQDTLPPNTHLWRRRSVWVTKGLMQEILKEPCEALGAFTASRQAVLLLDTASAHICPQFLRAASRRGVMVQYIPAKLTWLLQPLDTCLRQVRTMHYSRILRSPRTGWRAAFGVGSQSTRDRPGQQKGFEGVCVGTCFRCELNLCARTS